MNASPGEVQSLSWATLYDYEGVALRADGKTIRYAHSIWRVMNVESADHFSQREACYLAGRETVYPYLARSYARDAVRSLPLDVWHDLTTRDDANAPWWATARKVASIPGVTNDCAVEFAYFTVVADPPFPGELYFEKENQAWRMIVHGTRRVVAPAGKTLYVETRGPPPKRTDWNRGAYRVADFRIDFRARPMEWGASGMPSNADLFDRMWVSTCHSAKSAAPAIESHFAALGVPPCPTVARAGPAVHADAAKTFRAVLGIPLSGDRDAPWYDRARPVAESERAGYLTAPERLPVLLARLRRAGIRAFPVVAATYGGYNPKVPSPLVLNHALAGYTDAGRLFLLDPSAYHLPAGWLPVWAEGRRAFAVTPGGPVGIR